ncbi:hypothetical protein DRP05_06085 [Archaeoglobales archaeon]|nr:MAG: hypothetical protein DRP05_06085 [Archaeoglobales archaeon]
MAKHSFKEFLVKKGVKHLGKDKSSSNEWLDGAETTCLHPLMSLLIGIIFVKPHMSLNFDGLSLIRHLQSCLLRECLAWEWLIKINSDHHIEFVVVNCYSKIKHRAKNDLKPKIHKN